MSQFDKNKCISNIYSLVKELGLRIGDLEEKAGVSIGYLSRLNKEDSRTVPGVDFLLSVADTLHVSLDSLIKCDFNLLSADERKIIDFLSKLINETSSFSQIWIKHSLPKLRGRTIPAPKGSALHPLMIYLHSGGFNYNSLFFPDAKCSMIEYYETNISKNEKVLLSSVVYENDDGEQVPGYEMYLQTKVRVYQVCYSLEDDEAPFLPLIKALLWAAKNTTCHIHLDDAVKSSIDSYMNKDINTDYISIHRTYKIKEEE